MKLVIDDKIPYMQGQAERLGTCVYLPGADISAEDVRDADVVVTRTRTKCNAALLEGSKVSFIATATIGFDHIDTSYLASRGIAWSNCPGCNASSVAQYIESCLDVIAERCTLPQNPVIAIVGVGHVGSAVRHMLETKGYQRTPDAPKRLLLCDPALGYNDDITQADIITYHVPLTHDGAHPTYHMVDEALLMRLRPHAVLLNTSRGGVFDEMALLRCPNPLIIDCWEGEPAINNLLLERALIATPHIAGYSADGKAQGTRMALAAIATHFGQDLDFSTIEPPAAPPDYCYNVLNDDAALRSNPSLFEQLRGNYPLRRETTHY